MQRIIYLTAFLALSGCTSLLLGDNSTGDKQVTTSPGETVPSEEDQALAESIKRAIDADPKLSKYVLNVRSVDDNVIISGTVGSYTAKDRVVEIASGIDELDSVSYRIAVDTRL